MGFMFDGKVCFHSSILHHINSPFFFPFEANHSKTILSISLISDLHVKLKAIGTDPGHKQSGQYLWPAATDLSNHLITSYSSSNSSSSTSSSTSCLSSTSVIELGAGCGLAGIVAHILGAKSVLCTDYDLGCIDLIQSNDTPLFSALFSTCFIT